MTEKEGGSNEHGCKHGKSQKKLHNYRQRWTSIELSPRPAHAVPEEGTFYHYEVNASSHFWTHFRTHCCGSVEDLLLVQALENALARWIVFSDIWP